jgi:hypothetical protein
MADDDFVCPPPVSARDHPARRLALCAVEDLLAERGLDVSYETVRRWVGVDAVTFHGPAGGLIVFLGSLGLLFDNIPREARPFWINVHVCVGPFCLALVRPHSRTTPVPRSRHDADERNEEYHDVEQMMHDPRNNYQVAEL